MANPTPSLPFKNRLNTALIGFMVKVFVRNSIGLEYLTDFPPAGVME